MLIINKVKVALLTVFYTSEYQHSFFKKHFCYFSPALHVDPIQVELFKLGQLLNPQFSFGLVECKY